MGSRAPKHISLTGFVVVGTTMSTLGGSGTRVNVECIVGLLCFVLLLLSCVAFRFKPEPHLMH